ncbi:Uncharacterised protein [Candidatus Burarchaeum australiense]|nr:Uncharacterised protein [Candidatus Burarchaeum australiense]
MLDALDKELANLSSALIEKNSVVELLKTQKAALEKNLAGLRAELVPLTHLTTFAIVKGSKDGERYLTLRNKIDQAEETLSDVKKRLDKIVKRGEITKLQQEHDGVHGRYFELKSAYDANVRTLQEMLKDESLQEYHGTIITSLGDVMTAPNITFLLARSAISAPPETKRFIFDLFSLLFKESPAAVETELIKHLLLPMDRHMAAFFLLRIAEASPRAPELGGITEDQRSRFENKVLEYALQETWYGNAQTAELLVRRMILPRKTGAEFQSHESESFRRGALQNISALLSETSIDASDRKNLLSTVVSAMLRVMEHDRIVRNGDQAVPVLHSVNTEKAYKMFIATVLERSSVVSLSTKTPEPLSLAVEACYQLYLCKALPLQFEVEEHGKYLYGKEFRAALLSVFDIPELPFVR